MGTSDRFENLGAADPAAVAMFGEEACRRRVEAWVASQLARCSDEAWAAEFAAACPFPGTTASDYLQRVVTSPRGAALVGIRMRGGDVTRPFVDLLAVDGPLEELVGTALEALDVFRPRLARVRWPGTQPPDAGGYAVAIDQWVCAGRVRPEARGPVALVPVEDLELALGFVADAYRAWWTLRPELSDEIRPVDRAELAACLEAGGAHWITVEQSVMGLIAAMPESDREWSGWLMIEEVVLPAHAGRGRAVSAQRALSAQLGEPVLWGTISGHNAASLRTATRAGRPPTGAWWWLSP